MTAHAKRVLLVDRDGVLVVDRPDYVRSVEQLELIPGAGRAVAAARAAGYAVVVLSNQACVGKGLLTLPQLSTIHAALGQLLSAEGGPEATIDAYYVCPHHPDDGCACRKPRTGLFEQAADDWPFEPASTTYVGDDPRDAEAARAVGCRFALVRTGRGRATEARGAFSAGTVDDDLEHVVARLLSREVPAV